MSWAVTSGEVSTFTFSIHRRSAERLAACARTSARSWASSPKRWPWAAVEPMRVTRIAMGRSPSALRSNSSRLSPTARTASANPAACDTSTDSACHLSTSVVSRSTDSISAPCAVTMRAPRGPVSRMCLPWRFPGNAMVLAPFHTRCSWTWPSAQYWYPRASNSAIEQGA